MNTDQLFLILWLAACLTMIAVYACYLGISAYLSKEGERIASEAEKTAIDVSELFTQNI